MIFDISDKVTSVIVHTCGSQLTSNYEIEKNEFSKMKTCLEDLALPRIVTANKLMISRKVSDLYNSLNDIIIRQLETSAIIPKDLVHFLT